MNIVVEGVDASGKSTLIAALRERTGRIVMPSEGPPKYEGEMNERVARYLPFRNVIFDRHPCVSQPIYGTLRTHYDAIDESLTRAFYSTQPFFVYCMPATSGFASHVANEGEDPEHLAAVEKNYQRLLLEYHSWGLKHAHVLYRLGKDFEFTVNLICEGINV